MNDPKIPVHVESISEHTAFEVNKNWTNITLPEISDIDHARVPNCSWTGASKIGLFILLNLIPNSHVVSFKISTSWKTSFISN